MSVSVLFVLSLLQRGIKQKERGKAFSLKACYAHVTVSPCSSGIENVKRFYFFIAPGCFYAHWRCFFSLRTVLSIRASNVRIVFAGLTNIESPTIPINTRNILRQDTRDVLFALSFSVGYPPRFSHLPLPSLRPALPVEFR